MIDTIYINYRLSLFFIAQAQVHCLYLNIFTATLIYLRKIFEILKLKYFRAIYFNC